MTPANSLFRSFLLVVCLGSALSSCSSTKKEEAAVQPERKSDAFWIGDQVSGSPRLVIDLSAQRIRYYKGEKLVGVSPISSGREGHSTVTGSFRISQKSRHHRSSLYGDFVDTEGNVVVSDVDVRKDPRPPGTRFLGAKMNYFMRVVGAIGMHEGYLPGYPASHGCIRLPTDMAAHFYNATPHGTPVQIVGNAAFAPYEQPVRTPSAVQPSASPDSSDWLRPSRRSRSSKRAPLHSGTTLYL
jgi:hypothetical protein